MRTVEELLARINQITVEFAELASNSTDSITELTDEDLAQMVGERAHESAVTAHRIVGKLRDAASQIEVLAYTLNRRSASQTAVCVESSEAEVPMFKGSPRYISSDSCRDGENENPRTKKGDLN